MIWDCRGVELSESVYWVMGILNVTPDSFSDGGRYRTEDAALQRVEQMVQEGANVIDIGGESTRPGFEPISETEELDRVLPIIRSIRATFPNLLLSIDTRKARVAHAALAEGISIINDVSGLQDEAMAACVTETRAGYVLMHGYEQHVTRQRPSTPEARVECFLTDLRERYQRALAFGIRPEQIALDPGFGFGKRWHENREILELLPTLRQTFERPLLVGASRKHFVCELFPETAGDPVRASVCFACEARRLGAQIFRVHDVLPTCVALQNLVY